MIAAALLAGALAACAPAGRAGDAASSGGDAIEEKESAPMSSTMVTMRVGDATLRMVLADTAAARELAERLQGGPVTLGLSDYGGFEKVGPLPWGLTAADARITTVPGDVVLYQGNQISVFYGGNSWSYTMIGHVDGATRESMLDVLGSGDPTVELSLS
jgi:hypothetical protein